MIMIWMKSLSNDIDCNTVIYNAQKFLQGMANSFRFTYNMGDTTHVAYT